MVPFVQSSANYGLGCLLIAKNIFSNTPTANLTVGWQQHKRYSNLPLYRSKTCILVAQAISHPESNYQWSKIWFQPFRRQNMSDSKFDDKIGFQLKYNFTLSPIFNKFIHFWVKSELKELNKCQNTCTLKMIEIHQKWLKSIKNGRNPSKITKYSKNLECFE